MNNQQPVRTFILPADAAIELEGTRTPALVYFGRPELEPEGVPFRRGYFSHAFTAADLNFLEDIIAEIGAGIIADEFPDDWRDESVET